jgi:preprotein translocase subunit SecF
MRIFKNINYEFLGNRKIAYAISGTLIVLGLISLIIRGLSYGIDFKGGSEIALGFEKPVDIAKVRENINNIGLGKVEVKTFGGETGVLVRTELQSIPKNIFPKVVNSITTAIKQLHSDIKFQIVDSTSNSITIEFDNNEIASQVSNELFRQGFQTSKLDENNITKDIVVRVGISDWIKENIKHSFADNNFKVLKEEHVGPKIGKELKMDAIISIVLALIVILIYLGFRFKFIFAVGAVTALFHDVLITLGLFSLLQGVTSFLNLDISINVVAAFLTLVGYSINDTVVVFDRVRENIKLHKTLPIKENINNAINQTLPRTIITSLTTWFVTAVLLVFGGEVLRSFAFTLFVGVMVGTYSSIFVASALVYEWAKKKGEIIKF